ncbi:hypothetical protein VTI74DRAFT_2264 [Chaetomium olivicolor]
MRHDPKCATFNSAYINEKVGFHLQNAFLDESTEDSLLGMLSYIGLMRDLRASKDIVPDEVWKMMPPDLEIEALQGRGHSSKAARQKNAVRRAYREDYFHNRPTWDIEADGQKEEEYAEPTTDLHIRERAQLAEILCNQPDNLSATELLELRIQAAELIVALCGKRETAKRKCIRRRARADVTAKEESPAPEPFPLLMDRKQCPSTSGMEPCPMRKGHSGTVEPAVMYDHFDRKHVQQLGGVKQISCNHLKCRGQALEFKHSNHFKNHVERVLGIKLRA